MCVWTVETCHLWIPVFIDLAAMSKSLLEKFVQDRNEQLNRNDARRIRSNVKAARDNPQKAAKRWPFELTQNALDAGPRSGRTTVAIVVTFDGKVLTFEHDGRLFASSDLAALLSGGSNKEFESTTTTGRFGTGFLQTHALSQRIHLRCLLEHDTAAELADLIVDRSGDEEAIFRNMDACQARLEAAQPNVDPASRATAQFSYEVDMPSAADDGIKAFVRTLPVLYSTCPKLGRVTITSGGGTRTFDPQEVITTTSGGARFLEREVCITDHRGTERHKTVRVESATRPEVGIVVVLQKEEDRWVTERLEPDSAKLLRRFPIPGTEYLPLSVRIDAAFDVPPERDEVPWQDANKASLEFALALLPPLVAHARDQNWALAMRPSRVARLPKQLADTKDSQVVSWLTKLLQDTAQSVALIPTIPSEGGDILPGVSADGRTCAIVVGEYDDKTPAHGVSFDEVWAAAAQLSNLNVPAKAVAVDWADVGCGWHSLGVKVRLVRITDVASAVKEGAKSLTELKVSIAPGEWLANFLNLVGRVHLQTRQTPGALLAGLLPDQHGRLRSHSELKLDESIPEELKKIASRCGVDAKSKLLSLELSDRMRTAGMEPLKSLLTGALQDPWTSRTLLEECIKRLDAQLPDSKASPSASEEAAKGAIALFHWAAKAGVTYRDLLKKIPLVSADGTSTRWAPNLKRPMAPVALWPEKARAFAGAYKRDRIMADDYVSFEGADSVFRVLGDEAVVFHQPLLTEVVRDLKPDRLKALGADGFDKIEDEAATFTQVPLLSAELIQRSQYDREAAQSLLGLVLNFVAGEDKTWEQPVLTTLRRGDEVISVPLSRALWLAELKSKAWIPVRKEDGALVPLPADAGNLTDLIQDQWLVGNDAAIRLLVSHFGFRELDLQLRAATQKGDRELVEAGLVKLVQRTGGSPETIGRLLEQLDRTDALAREKERNRRFGLAVQKAIRECLDARGIKLDLIDDGYDFDVFVGEIPTIEDGTHRFRAGDMLLEIKATTSGEVRLTPRQAETAIEEPKRFVLCVVDLRGISAQRMESDWSAADVAGRTLFLTGVGTEVNKPHQLVRAAAGTNVRIKNEGALRYGVPPELWASGDKLDAWVATIQASKTAAVALPSPR